MEQAVFGLETYKFDQVELRFEGDRSREIDVNFEPKGLFRYDSQIFELRLIFTAKNKDTDIPFVKIRCVAYFKFDNQNKVSFDKIPPYFFANSLAIIFPYIRAFVSTITLQTNIQPAIVIPTWNLMSLNEVLKSNTQHC
ncbi:hypothetical protein E2605_09505 [Dysgonomonas capnocytophagoides]|uniref:Preprotein translocase subunit SecB n=1 Tax=Dysgonomonas capnocytophagoides TaxID=45254 RepID=A0A4Y8L289_9BACT|nr:protein-export chaperone SecB [Dysgonomonas capnocytophagoides]TFD96397.1 hypothetical protein E2605_09505 [Dysgonomonas capnocytophagoides]